MKITDRIPNMFARRKPMWATRPRSVAQLATDAGREACVGELTDEQRAKLFARGVNRFFTRTTALRREFNRFTTTPDWEGVKGALAGAASMFKQ